MLRLRTIDWRDADYSPTPVEAASSATEPNEEQADRAGGFTIRTTLVSSDATGLCTIRARHVSISATCSPKRCASRHKKYVFGVAALFTAPFSRDYSFHFALHLGIRVEYGYCII